MDGLERASDPRQARNNYPMESVGIKGIPIPYNAPDANAHCERLNGTLRIECLDHVIFGDHAPFFTNDTIIDTSPFSKYRSGILEMMVY